MITSQAQLLQVQAKLIWHQHHLLEVTGSVTTTRILRSSQFVQEKQNDCVTRHLRQSRSHNKHSNFPERVEAALNNGDLSC